MTQEQTKILERFEGSFLPKVQEIFGENLVSVTIYGSAVKGRWSDGVSDVNSLIILKHADPAAVIELGSNAGRIMKKNRINPLLLTEEEYLGSADVFPMEYLDITASRKVVYGEDLTERLDITSANLRHQIEEQLRGSVASLRRALLEIKRSDRRMKRILTGWFGSQYALFRSLLRLHSTSEIPADPGEIIPLLAKTYSIDPAPLQAIVGLRSGDGGKGMDVAKEILGCFVELTRKVDSMDSSL